MYLLDRQRPEGHLNAIRATAGTGGVMRVLTYTRCITMTLNHCHSRLLHPPATCEVDFSASVSTHSFRAGRVSPPMYGSSKPHLEKSDFAYTGLEFCFLRPHVKTAG